MPIFILDDESAGEWKYGGASRWFLYEALNNLSKQLDSWLENIDDLGRIPELELYNLIGK